MGKKRAGKRRRREVFGLHRPWLILSLLSLAAVTVFLPAIRGGWVSDDNFLISGNPLVHSFDHAGDWFRGTLFPASVDRSNELAPFYRPLVTTSYAFDWAWGEAEPFAFHLTNLLVHLGAVLLAYFTMLRWTGHRAASFWACLWFAVHPAKAESVAWITGRTDLFVTFFLLLSCLGYARARRAKKFSWRLVDGVMAAASLLLAFLSKESAVLCPAFWMAEELALLRSRDAFSPKSVRSALIRGGAWGASAVCAYLVARQTWLPLFRVPGESVRWGEHLILVFETWGRHLTYLLWPLDLAMFDTTALAERTSWSANGFAQVGATGTALLLGALILTWKKERTIFLLLLLFVACLVPTSNLAPTALPLRAQARFLYLPSVPFFLATVLLLFSLLGSRKAASERRYLVAHLVCGMVALLLSFRTLQRSSDFESGRQFFLSELKTNPTAPTVVYSLASGDLMMQGREVALARARCGLQAAEKHYGGYEAEDLVIAVLRYAAMNRAEGAPELAVMADFLAAVRTGGKPALQGELSLKPSSVVLKRLQSRPRLLLQEEALLRFRAGQRRRAQQVGDHLLKVCPQCNDIRLRLAQTALLFGDSSVANRWARGLSGPALERFRLAAETGEAAVRLQGPARLFKMAVAGHLARHPDFSFRLLQGSFDDIEKSKNPDVYRLVLLVARASGETETVHRFFQRLPPEMRQLMLQAGWELPEKAPSDQFAPGTCAFPDEL